MYLKIKSAFLIVLATAGACACLVLGSAPALGQWGGAPWGSQSCNAYFTFDGNLADTGGNGYDGTMIGKKGVLATPQFSDGKFGQALQLTGDSAMRAFVDLHFDTCPQVTITAWVQYSGEVSGTKNIVSTGFGNGPGIRSVGSSLNLSGTANGIWQTNGIRQGAGWMFVAGVYDYEAGTYTLYSRGRSMNAKIGSSRKVPEEAIWVGALNDGLAGAASNVLIDDLRIYGRALDKDEIHRLRIGETEKNLAGTFGNCSFPDVCKNPAARSIESKPLPVEPN